MLDLEIVTLGDAPVPFYATEGAAGFDLTNQGPDVTIAPGCLARIATGIKMRIPPGYVGLLTPRSGKSFKEVGFSVANSPGIIDEDFQDEVGILACNYGNDPINLAAGERIGQLVVVPYIRCKIKHVEQLTPVNSTRAGGFGSTGQ
jgi:dUTP pyrophosphatase